MKQSNDDRWTDEDERRALEHQQQKLQTQLFDGELSLSISEQNEMEDKLKSIQRKLGELRGHDHEESLWVRVPSHDDGEEDSRKPKRKGKHKNGFSGTPFGDADLRILSIEHGRDFRRTKNFQRDDPQDRKAFCSFVRGCLVDSFICNLLGSQNPIIEEKIMNSPIPKNPPADFDSDSRKHRTISAALSHTKDDWEYLTEVHRHRNQARRFVEEHDLGEAKAARFQMALALLGERWEGLSMRDLRVLMAVNSCLEGDPAWGIIHLNVLGMRAVGACNKDQLELLEVEPMSEMQVRRALDSLQEHGLIQRITYGRTTYATKGNTDETYFKMVVSNDIFKGRPKRAYVKDGKLVVEQVGNV